MRLEQAHCRQQAGNGRQKCVVVFIVRDKHQTRRRKGSNTSSVRYWPHPAIWRSMQLVKLPVLRQSKTCIAAMMQRQTARPPMRPSAPRHAPNFNDVPAHVESFQDEIPAAIPPAMADQQPTYHPRDALHNTGNAMIQTTLVGAVIAGVQNTLRKQNVGAMGIITRSGGVLALFGAQIPNWQFAKSCAAN